MSPSSSSSPQSSQQATGIFLVVIAMLSIPLVDAFGEIPNLFTIIGAGLIIAVGLVLIRSSTR